MQNAPEKKIGIQVPGHVGIGGGVVVVVAGSLVKQQTPPFEQKMFSSASSQRNMNSETMHVPFCCLHSSINSGSGVVVVVVVVVGLTVVRADGRAVVTACFPDIITGVADEANDDPEEVIDPPLLGNDVTVVGKLV